MSDLSPVTFFIESKVNPVALLDCLQAIQTALSEKMPILPKLNRAIRLPELFASGNRWTLPADNAFDAKSIVRRG
ncbi:MAG: hypothetical protein KKA28_17895, partial [Planctomycetes bacterium]|nr:hypothetical protein [Planctomycetota bacterium]MCG2682714.1 hypothetical protein [Planctomycetales bacterium]